VVTGAGSGIGRAVTGGLLASGFHVAALGRTADTIAESVQSIDAAGTRSMWIECDVRLEPDVEAAFDDVVDRFGRIDVLFNNAGVFGPSSPVGDYELQAWNSVIETDLTGAFLCAREAFRVMTRQRPIGGRIINNGSISAHVPRPNAIAYTAAKHGITGLTKALWLEGRDFDIASGQIDIGNAETSMTQRLSDEPLFDVRHVVDAIVYVARLPTTVNVPSITVMASRMPYAGRG
jgi:NAD(P)-dependent dehydrogenase (short-subunit alcohol dehydrogenase family)